jgi:hypothetical protein
MPRFRRTIWVSIGVLLNLWSCRYFWIRREIEPSGFELRSFEEYGGRPVILRDPKRFADLYPLLDVDRLGQLNLFPGTTVSVSLQDGVSYRITALNAPAPYVVLGDDRPWPKGGNESPVPRFIDGARVLTVIAPGELGWREWRSNQPWRADRAWLQELVTACGAADRANSLAITRAGDRLIAELGRCRVEETLSWPTPALAVLAGPAAASIERPTGWPRSSSIEWMALLAVAVLSLVSLFAIGSSLGWVTAIVGASCAAAVSGVSPGSAWLFSLLLLQVALVMLLWRPLARRRSPRWAVVAASTLLLCELGTLELVSHTLKGALEKRVVPPPVVDRVPGAPACLVAGYSTASDSTLLESRSGFRAYLNSECAPCAARTARYSVPGAHFPVIQEHLEAPEIELRRGGSVLFLGGTNDDFLGTILSREPGIPFTLGLLWIAYSQWMVSQGWGNGHERSFSAQLERLKSLDSSGTGLLPLQRQALESTATRLDQRGRRFIYLHDFVVWDLVDGRSAGRQWSADDRRSITNGAGGEFIDLLTVLGPEAGVSWFNDLIHLSVFGHRRVGETACTAINRAGPSREWLDVARP